MKTLELELKKRLVIWGYPDNYEIRQDIDIMYFWNKETGATIDIPSKYAFICKGSELKEEVAKELVDPLWDYYKNYLESDSSDIGNYKRLIKNTALESFISAIEAQGYYWGENPVSLVRAETYRSMGDEFKADGIQRAWQEAESKTFNPEKTLIFEIL